MISTEWVWENYNNRRNFHFDQEFHFASRVTLRLPHPIKPK